MTADGTVKVGETTPLDFDYYEIGKSPSKAPTANNKITDCDERGTMTLNISSTSGIADIEAADAAARYFNLQGVEVANPPPASTSALLAAKPPKSSLTN